MCGTATTPYTQRAKCLGSPSPEMLEVRMAKSNAHCEHWPSSKAGIGWLGLPRYLVLVGGWFLHTLPMELLRHLDQAGTTKASRTGCILPSHAQLVLGLSGTPQIPEIFHTSPLELDSFNDHNQECKNYSCRALNDCFTQ